MKIIHLTEELKKGFIQDIKNSDSIDLDMLPYLVEINKIPFVCTTQCCQGHPNNGYLSIMVMANMVEKFETEVFEPLIKDIADKRYENMYDGTIKIRYVFYYDSENRDSFIKTLIKKLNGLVLH